MNLQSPFTISLTQEQFEYISHCLPKRYSLSKTKRKGRRPKCSSLAASQTQSKRTDNQNPQSIIESSECSQKLKSKNLETERPQGEVQASQSLEQMEDKISNVTDPNLIDDQLKTRCQYIVSTLKKKKCSKWFLQPVDPVKLKIPTYFKVIKEPMDLTTLQNNVYANKYDNFQLFLRDLDKISDNCLKFNAGNPYFQNLAKDLKKESQKLIQSSKFKSFSLQNKIKAITKKELSSNRILKQDDKNDHQKSSDNSSKKEIISSKILKKQNDKKNKKLQQPLTSSQQKKEKEKEESKQLEQEKEINPNEKTQRTDYVKPQMINGKQKQKTNKIDKNTIPSQFSQKFRIQMVARIKKLDKKTMIDFFKQINFGQGDSLDLKAMSVEELTKIQTELKKAEKIYKEKIQTLEARQSQKGDKEKTKFEIAPDEDYDD